jgi:hypothetical protein
MEAAMNSGSSTGNGGGGAVNPRSHHASAVVEPGGSIRVEHVPFAAGAVVDVMVTSVSCDEVVNEGALHGTVLRDAAPFDPAAPPEDWEASR